MLSCQKSTRQRRLLQPPHLSIFDQNPHSEETKIKADQTEGRRQNHELEEDRREWQGSKVSILNKTRFICYNTLKRKLQLLNWDCIWEELSRKTTEHNLEKSWSCLNSHPNITGNLIKFKQDEKRINFFLLVCLFLLILLYESCPAKVKISCIKTLNSMLSSM